jgi:hypothetical protein
MTCKRCKLARPEAYGEGFRCGCCGLHYEMPLLPPFPPENGGYLAGTVVREGETLKQAKNAKNGWCQNEGWGVTASHHRVRSTSIGGYQ